jgi:imidazolonepropionase-like amidohydrolase
MTNLEALRAGTMCGAEGLGLDRDLGSIEAGKLADFIVLNKNPLDDIRNTMAIRWVVKNGEVFDGDTLEEFWPQQKPAPRNWWQDDVPQETHPVQ